jgi:hypothetical protein
MTNEEIRATWDQLCAAEQRAQIAFLDAQAAGNIDQIRVAMQSIDKVQMAQDDFRTRHNFYVIPQA